MKIAAKTPNIKAKKVNEILHIKSALKCFKSFPKALSKATITICCLLLLIN